jgi:hypothetical protein
MCVEPVLVETLSLQVCDDILSTRLLTFLKYYLSSRFIWKKNIPEVEFYLRV